MRLLILIFILGLPFIGFSQSLSKNEKSKIIRFTELVKQQKRHELLAYFDFSQHTTVPAGVPRLISKKVFLSHYDKLFSPSLNKRIIQAKPADWTKMGSRGIMLDEGILWFNESLTRIIAINGTE